MGLFVAVVVVVADAVPDDVVRFFFPDDFFFSTPAFLAPLSFNPPETEVYSDDEGMICRSAITRRRCLSSGCQSLRPEASVRSSEYKGQSPDRSSSHVGVEIPCRRALTPFVAFPLDSVGGELLIRISYEIGGSTWAVSYTHLTLPTIYSV